MSAADFSSGVPPRSASSTANTALVSGILPFREGELSIAAELFAPLAFRFDTA